MGAGKAGYYRHEMTDEQHVELLEFLNTLTGMVVLSGTTPNSMTIACRAGLATRRRLAPVLAAEASPALKYFG